MTYIALLRGINVGGQKSMKMADIVKLFESLSFRNVRTYVQSGNLIFESDLFDASTVAKRIQQKIQQTYGYAVNIIIRTPEELKKVVSNNQFVREHKTALDKLYVTFLADLADERSLSDLEIKKDRNEKFIVKGKEIYLYCPNGYAKTKLNNATFEKKLKTIATTRNWKTTNKLLELSESKKM